ncbi:MAG: QueT transporter family protein [Coriobacteriia bacterium]|nr:QueT transporter family protein [Coriobacteriia bacterium]
MDKNSANADRNISITRIAMIAALYAALTMLTLTFLQGFAWGPVQFRVSEALCILALFTPAAIPGLTLGCILANLLGILLVGSGPLGLLDVFFGSMATLLGSLWMWHFKDRKPLALLGPVVTNALIVSAYLPLMLAALGFYTIPFTTIDLAGTWPAMYIFGFICIATGEAIVVYGMGWPLAKMLESSGFADKLR